MKNISQRCVIFSVGLFMISIGLKFGSVGYSLMPTQLWACIGLSIEAIGMVALGGFILICSIFGITTTDNKNKDS